MLCRELSHGFAGRDTGSMGGEAGGLMLMPNSLMRLLYGQGGRERRGLQGCGRLWEISTRTRGVEGWLVLSFLFLFSLTAFSYSIMGCSNERKLTKLLIPPGFGWCSKGLNAVLGLGTETLLLLKHLENSNRSHTAPIPDIRQQNKQPDLGGF